MSAYSPGVSYASNLCATCGIPLDAGIFDESTVFSIQTPTEGAPHGANRAELFIGESLELARFALQDEHCGVLLSFAQFTDRFAANPRFVATPGYQWAILCNDQPLAPWLSFDRIINPWGLAGFPLSLRLEAGCTLSFVIRNLDVKPRDPQRWLRIVGGRLVGRFWFNQEDAGRYPVRVNRPW